MQARIVEQLVSIDLGRTATKICMSFNPNEVVLIPANVKHLPVDVVRRGAEEPDEGDPLLDIWFEFQGQGYALGQLAADLGADLGLEKPKTTDALLKVLAAVGHLGLGGKGLGIVVGLPYLSKQQFDQQKAELISRLEGTYHINYRGEPITVAIQHVWVMPEGYGSLVVCEHQEQTNRVNLGLAEVPVAMMDIGYETTDFLVFDRLRMARGVSRSMEFAMSRFYEQLAAPIPGADSQSLTLIEAVNYPEGKRFYRPHGVNKVVDLDPLLLGLKTQFAQDLYQLLIDWLPERTHTIVVTGGGGAFFWENLHFLIKAGGLTPHLAKPTRKANALGQYIHLALPARQTKLFGQYMVGEVKRSSQPTQ